MSNLEQQRWLVIPPDQLNDETFTAVIEEFISREGTDYGQSEVPFEQQVKRADMAIKSGEVLIVFDTELQSCQLLRSEEYKKLCTEAEQAL